MIRQGGELIEKNGNYWEMILKQLEKSLRFNSESYNNNDYQDFVSKNTTLIAYFIEDF